MTKLDKEERKVAAQCNAQLEVVSKIANEYYDIAKKAGVIDKIMLGKLHDVMDELVQRSKERYEDRIEVDRSGESYLELLSK